MTMLQRISRTLLPPAILLAALLAYRLTLVSAGSSADDSLPGPAAPWKITPVQSEPRIVTDEQLVAVLDRVKPPTDPLLTNNLVHALRLWGPQADFHDPKVPSGSQLLNYFLDDRTFRQLAGDQEPPLFYVSRDGVDVRSFDDGIKFRNSSSHHADDLLATLAESGVPLHAPLHMREGEATVQDLLDTALQRFHLDRYEYEWSIIAYGRYLFPLKQWRNKYGERITLDGMVNELVEHPLPAGPCNGLHRLEALVVLYRADEQAQALSPRTKAKMLAYMKQVSDLLVQSQTVDGYWTRQWPAGAAAAKDTTATLHDKILVTGHQLEWLALAPDSVQPPRETIVRAGQWLARTLADMDKQTLLSAYGPYSHGARALCLWRQVEPYEAWKLGRSEN